MPKCRYRLTINCGRFIFITLFFSLSSFATISYGDGSDGACNFTGGAIKATWNCTSLTTSGTTTFTGTSVVRIYVDGDVTIDGTLSVNASGTTAGPGGTNGATCAGGTAGTCTGQNASGAGGGNGGTHIALTSGAGGAGGHFLTKAQLQLMDKTVTELTVVVPVEVEGVADTGDIANPANFNSSITGGFGGGAGAHGNDGAQDENGGNGGGGGGAIVIVASGSITINGSITANGANGTVGSDANFGQAGGGGGGGGSGGAIYIVSGTSITIDGTATISAQRGTGAAGGTPGFDDGGSGGNGSQGAIRLEAPTGMISNLGGGTFVPSFANFSSGTPPTYLTEAGSGSSTQDFSSDLSVGCARVELEDPAQYIINFLFGLMIIFTAVELRRRY